MHSQTLENKLRNLYARIVLIQGICDDKKYSDINDSNSAISGEFSTVSCDSFYSDIRVGKQQMVEKFFQILPTLPIELTTILSVLDIPCARGSFLSKAPLYFKNSNQFIGFEQDQYLCKVSLNKIAMTRY